jgi:putative transposase
VRAERRTSGTLCVCRHDWSCHRRPPRERRPQPRAVRAAERAAVRAVLNSEEHVDKAPAAGYHALLDQGVYLASVSTMYRILRAHDEVHERRRQASHPARVKPELVATEPNTCWSWDITKLHGPAKWTYCYLYVIIDIFSRSVVGCSPSGNRRPWPNSCSPTPSPSTTSTATR